MMDCCLASAQLSLVNVGSGMTRGNSLWVKYLVTRAWSLLKTFLSSSIYKVLLFISTHSWGQPWAPMGSLCKLQEHTLLKVLYEIQGARGIVSKLYGYVLEKTHLPWPVDPLWRADIPHVIPGFDWDKVWDMVKPLSRNLDHQQIHLNCIHRTYMSPRKLYSMKLRADPICTHCHIGAVGTFYLMIWECPDVADATDFKLSLSASIKKKPKHVYFWLIWRPLRRWSQLGGNLHIH